MRKGHVSSCQMHRTGDVIGQQKIRRVSGRALLLEMSMLFFLNTSIGSEYFPRFLKNKKTLVCRAYWIYSNKNNLK